MQLKFLRWTLLGAVILGLFGCSAGEPDQTFKYKMTISVATPQGTVTGSAVRALEFREGGGFWFGEGKAQIKLIGEAVAIDLPDGQTLFALLRGSDGDVDYAGRIADRTGLWGGKNSGSGDNPLELWPTAPKTEKMTYTSAVPILVTFPNLSDPTTMEIVEPDNLAKNFGKGIRLNAITIEFVEEPVTVSIEKRFGKEFFARWASFNERISHCSRLDHPYFRQPATKLHAAKYEAVAGPA